MPTTTIEVKNQPNEKGELIVKIGWHRVFMVLNILAFSGLGFFFYKTDHRNLISDYGASILLLLIPILYLVMVALFSIEVYFFKKKLRDVQDESTVYPLSA